MDLLLLSSMLDEVIVDITDRYDTLREQKIESMDDGGDGTEYYHQLKWLEEKIEILEEARNIIEWM